MKNLFPFFILLITVGCGNSDKSELEKVKFNQIGYFKSPDNLRYFTFYMDTDLNIDNESDYAELKEIVEEHGSELMNTSGKVTVGFYYTNKSSTPDISNYDAQKANELAHDKQPIFSVWNYGNGTIKLIESPE